jgi:hypothetical protein
MEMNKINTQKTAFHVGILSTFTESDTVKIDEKTYNKIPFKAYRSRHSISSKFLINCFVSLIFFLSLINFTSTSSVTEFRLVAELVEALLQT